MVRIRVAIRDKVGKDFTIKEIKRIQKVSQLDLKRIAKETEEIIHRTIELKTNQSTGKLASFFYAHKIPNGWAVGDIDELDKIVPYWNHLDKGSEGIGANWDHFLPKGFWENGRWVTNDQGFAGIQPKTPIQAVNYIAETLAHMTIRIPQILRK